MLTRTPRGGDSSIEASVIVRTWNQAATVEATLRSLRAQTAPVEIVVVDSGSTDGTRELARRWADVVVSLDRRAFTYGRALNVGAAAASGSVHFALSAHGAHVPRAWVEDSLLLYADERVAGTGGAQRSPTGRPIADVYLQTSADARSHPAWGFSNHASSWRAHVWAAEPFHEDLIACEDKEWSWRVLDGGHLLAYSARLVVPTDHRRREGLRRLYGRTYREAVAMVTLGAARPLTASEAIGAWWSSFYADSRYPRPIRRLSPFRVTELAAAWAGGRVVGGHEPGTVPLGSHRAGEEAVTPPPYLPWLAEPDAGAPAEHELGGPIDPRHERPAAGGS